MSGRRNTDLPRRDQSFSGDSIFPLITRVILKEEAAGTVEVELNEGRERSPGPVLSEEVGEIEGRISGEDSI